MKYLIILDTIKNDWPSLLYAFVAIFGMFLIVFFFTWLFNKMVEKGSGYNDLSDYEKYILNKYKK